METAPPARAGVFARPYKEKKRGRARAYPGRSAHPPPAPLSSPFPIPRPPRSHPSTPPHSLSPPPPSHSNFGFDPLKLAEVPSNLQRYQEAELQHCRWAMLGAAGALAVEVLGYGDWVSSQAWAATPGGHATWFGVNNPLSISTLVAIQAVLFAAAEGARANEADPEKRKYPGGSFDPLGWGKAGAGLEELKLKELKNGRLAMVAFVGFIGQHAATGKSPLAALSEHLANPWANNVATNGVSIPGL